MKESRKPPDPNHLRTAYAACQPHYSKALERIQREVQSALSRDRAVFTIKSRVKSFKSYFEKALRLHTGQRRASITDMLGLRIICPFLDDVRRKAIALQADLDWREKEQRLR